jgi:ZIP family zinc transporter
MLSASFFSLILPGLDHATKAAGGELQGVLLMAAAILLGSFVLSLLNRYAPHEHFIKRRDCRSQADLSRIWLFVIAITLHNLPEGLAVGVSFGGGNLRDGADIAVAIGTQNLPEGLAVAAALVRIGYSRLRASVIALLTGLVEGIGGLIGVGVVALAQPLLPWGLGFAAGAMLFVISHEIIPETHRSGHESLATWGLMIGLVAMMLLDVPLG